MALQFTNYAGGFLLANMTAGQTTLTLGTGQGALFPTAGSGDAFYLTLIDQASFASSLVPPAKYEVVLCTSRSGDVFTITRAQDGTTAQIWSFNDRVELRLNAAAMGGVAVAKGTAVLVAGTVVVANTLVANNSNIQLTSQVNGGTPGFLRVSARTVGVSFTILSSSGTDTSTVGYVMF